jgi:hypothetical protein
VCGSGSIGGHQVPETGEVFDYWLSQAGELLPVESGIYFDIHQPEFEGYGKLQAAHAYCPMNLVQGHAVEFFWNCAGALVGSVPGLQAGYERQVLRDPSPQH